MRGTQGRSRPLRVAAAGAIQHKVGGALRDDSLRAESGWHTHAHTRNTRCAVRCNKSAHLGTLDSGVLRVLNCAASSGSDVSALERTK
jgi:hypothetical protein